MGRPRKRNVDLPECIYEKHGLDYFVTTSNEWIRMTKKGDKPGLYKALSELLGHKLTDMNAMFDKYEREKPSDIYCLRKVMMELAFVTGQRQADLPAIKTEDFRTEGIFVQQGKTGARIIIKWSSALRSIVHRAQQLQTETETVRYLVATRSGHPYPPFRAMWSRHLLKCIDEGILQEWFTFHDLRAKARSDGPDKKLLGHADPDKMDRVYQWKPTLVTPVK